MTQLSIYHKVPLIYLDLLIALHSGGGGYVLSKEALRRLAEKGNDSNTCRQDGGAEDAELGHCMQKLGVKTANSTDALGRSRFHCFDPETHLFGGYPDWYYQYDANGAKKADDDTYVIVENLRYFLSDQNTSEPIYFGHHFKTIVKQGYYSTSMRPSSGFKSMCIALNSL
uniref:N-acetylgalactosaminide beta-1,3-galactosyltransferase n=1 Tax=Biomphalaria glabrata TaxID=6526 RepID=A0A2C9JVT7_BIOGL